MVSSVTWRWSMCSICLKKKKSRNLVGWWPVGFLLVEMKTLLILKEKWPSLLIYSFFNYFLRAYCVLAPWIPQRGSRPGASLCLSVLEFHINGITPYILCWLFFTWPGVFAVIHGVACNSFLFRLCGIPLYGCITVRLPINLFFYFLVF